VITLIAIGALVGGQWIFRSHQGTTIRHRGDVKTYEVAVPTRTLGVCLDGTASSQPNFIMAIKNDLSNVVGHLDSTNTRELPSTAIEAQPALQLMVRAVTSDSYASSAPSLTVSLPATPRLASPPPVTDPNYNADFITWSEAESRWATIEERAGALARRAAGAIARFNVTEAPTVNSAIFACVSALAATSPGAPILIASDLQNNVPGVATRLDGAPITIIQNCDAINEQACPTLARVFSERLKSEGADSTTVARAEIASRVIFNFVRESR